MKNYSCRETGQSGQAPLVPPNKHKALLFKDDVPKNFLLFHSTFKLETIVNIHESEQQDSVDQEIETKVIFFDQKLYLLKKL